MFITEDKIRENVKENTNFIMWRHEIGTQRELSEKTGIGQAQLTRIMRGEQIPTVSPFLVSIKEHYGYSVDQFLFTKLKEQYEADNGTGEDIPMVNYMKFTGVYQMYYYDTSSFKGREREDNADALKSGLLLIQQKPNSEKEYRVAAVFNMDKEYADTCYKEVMKFATGNKWDNAWNYMTLLGGSNHVYYGDFELSAKHFYIALRFENTKDRVQMIFHRPDSNSNKYIGGLGTMVSVSKGRNAAPCVQYIGLSDASLNCSEEEIASHLLMHYPNLKTYDSVDDLVGMIVQLYQESGEEKSRLTEDQKRMLVRSHMDKIVNETVEKNLFRTVVVSAVDDDDFYHYVKRVKANMRQEARS